MAAKGSVKVKLAESLVPVMLTFKTTNRPSLKYRMLWVGVPENPVIVDEYDVDATDCAIVERFVEFAVKFEVSKPPLITLVIVFIGVVQSAASPTSPSTIPLKSGVMSPNLLFPF